MASASAIPDSSAKVYRRATVAALIVGPTLLLVDNLLHPTEFKRDHEARQLAQIADHYTRWQLAHVIGFAAIVVFAAAVLGLAWLVRRRQPTTGLIAGALGVVGLLGLASVITIDGYSWAVLGEVSGQGGADPATIRLALHDVQQSNWSAIYYTVPVAWIASMLILAAALWRQRAVPGWASGLFALGTLMVGTETFIAENAYFIGGAAVMLAGCLAVALPLARMSDGEFARGGPATAEPR